MYIDKPLFDFFPKPRWWEDRVMGSEVELGVCRRPEYSVKLAKSEYRGKLELRLPNGGRIYIDSCGQVEATTPEVNTAVALMAFKKATMQCAWVEFLKIWPELFGDSKDPPELIANNRDQEDEERDDNMIGVDSKCDHVWGNHENYLVERPDYPLEMFRNICPFLVARILIAGAGYVSSNGIFKISQRADFIECIQGDSTQKTRPLFGTRTDSRDSLNRYMRVHLISGDTNRCEYATWLKYAFTSMVIRLAERDELPRIRFRDTIWMDMRQLSDMAAMSLRTGELSKIDNWIMTSLDPRISALEVLRMHHRKALEVFGPCEALDCLGYVLEKLGSDPFALVGMQDWITKIWLFRQFIEEDGFDLESLLRNDVHYHSLNPDFDIFSDLESQGIAKRVVSDRMVRFARKTALFGTRAYFRAKAYRMVSKIPSAKFESGKKWGEVVIRNLTKEPIVIIINDPLNSYPEKIPELRKVLRPFRT